MADRVVVAVDGSTASDAALDWAIDRAATVDMHLEILTVVDIRWTRPTGADPGLAKHERVVFDGGRKVAASGSRVRCSTTVHHDHLVSGLLAASRRADLLVLGSHKPKRAIAAIHGTLPLVIAAGARSPLVVVPAGWEPDAGPVVVGVDGRSGTTAVAFAAAEAERTGTTLVAVRAWSVPSTLARALAADTGTLDAFEASQREVLDTVLAPIREAHGQLSIDAVLEQGRPSVVLAGHAQHARLTVIGSGAGSGRTLGSVGHDLLMNLPSPVAVIPETSRRAHPPAPEVADDGVIA